MENDASEPAEPPGPKVPPGNKAPSVKRCSFHEENNGSKETILSSAFPFLELIVNVSSDPPRKLLLWHYEM